MIVFGAVLLALSGPSPLGTSRIAPQMAVGPGRKPKNAAGASPLQNAAKNMQSMQFWQSVAPLPAKKAPKAPKKDPSIKVSEDVTAATAKAVVQLINKRDGDGADAGEGTFDEKDIERVRGEAGASILATCNAIHLHQLLASNGAASTETKSGFDA